MLPILRSLLPTLAKTVRRIRSNKFCVICEICVTFIRPHWSKKSVVICEICGKHSPTSSSNQCLASHTLLARRQGSNCARCPNHEPCARDPRSASNAHRCKRQNGQHTLKFLTRHSLHQQLMSHRISLRPVWMRRFSRGWRAMSA